jgi:hypothetical protein
MPAANLRDASVVMPLWRRSVDLSHAQSETARALSIDVPPPMLALADEIIE